MTDKEQTEEITKIINRRCEAELGQVHANSKDGKVTKTVDTSLIAKDIINAGYRKESETAKEIYSFIVNYCDLEHRDITNIQTFIKEKFNVEID